MSSATYLTKGSRVTVRVLYPGYHGSPVTTQKFGYDQFPPVANGWRTKYHVPDMAPQLLAEKERPPTYTELNLGVIHTSTYPTSIVMGGQDFTTYLPSPPHYLGSGHTWPFGSHAVGAHKMSISYANISSICIK
jgi:hypothetical protein